MMAFKFSVQVPNEKAIEFELNALNDHLEIYMYYEIVQGDFYTNFIFDFPEEDEELQDEIIEQAQQFK